MSQQKHILLSRAQYEIVSLLRTLTAMQGECTSVHDRDFNVVCRSIDTLQDINAEIHQLVQQVAQ